MDTTKRPKARTVSFLEEALSSYGSAGRAWHGAGMSDSAKREAQLRFLEEDAKVLSRVVSEHLHVGPRRTVAWLHAAVLHTIALAIDKADAGGERASSSENVRRLLVLAQACNRLVDAWDRFSSQDERWALLISNGCSDVAGIHQSVTAVDGLTDDLRAIGAAARASADCQVLPQDRTLLREVIVGEIIAIYFHYFGRLPTISKIEAVDGRPGAFIWFLREIATRIDPVWNNTGLVQNAQEQVKARRRVGRSR